MHYVATLIANPDRAELREATARAAAMSLPGGRVETWLAPGTAVDVVFDQVAAGPSPVTGADACRLAAEALRAHLGAAEVDIVVQPVAGRRKRLLVADMDSTMIGQECIDELADFAGFKTEVASITERAMRGELDFEPALRARVALLKGLPVSVIERVIAERIGLTPGGPTLIATMRANGAYTCLVSGGFTAFTDPLARRIGFDEQRANRLIVDAAGKLTGAVAEPIVGREAKLRTLMELRERLGLSAGETLAVGDGANDLAMVEAAGLGVAFRGKPALRRAAGACIDHGDLTALLYAQGYRRDEFVPAKP
jgi:phosphoserine phosphatase